MHLLITLNNGLVEVDRRFTLKYTKPERMDIAKKIYDGEMTSAEAAVKYDLNFTSVKNYVRRYRLENNLPPRIPHNVKSGSVISVKVPSDNDLEKFATMTKEELIRELVKAKVTEARLKKGYMVKGAGAAKEFVSLDGKNTK